jgi:O-succinylbenzoic acid--CoA ligase
MTSLRDIATGWGDALFMRGANGVLSYSQLVHKIAEAQQRLSSAGVGAGDIVALQCAIPEQAIGFLIALLDLKAHVFPINLRWPDAMVSESRKRIGAHFTLRGEADGEVKIIPHNEVASAEHLRSAPASIIVGTSGSTGSPKFAVLPLEALLTSARGAQDLLALRNTDCWQLSLPLFHVGGLGILWRVLLAGASCAVSDRKDPWAAEFSKCVTFLSLVPTQLYRLLRNPEAGEYLKQQRCILVGGAPIGADLCRQALSMDLPVVPSYGLTEMGSIVTAGSPLSISDDGSVSMGWALPGREVALSASGEILVRGECLFAGYLTAEGLVRDTDGSGWFGTRDIGSFQGDGSLIVRGRIDSQFISGGENIHPEMIEQALTAIPPIVAACVVPLEDPEFGQRPFAFVVSDGRPFNPGAIQAQLKESIPSFAVPIGLVEVPEDLVTGSGKIDRRAALRYAQTFGVVRSRY